MGEEYGETAPFLYFVSHGDEELIEAVRIGRSEESLHFTVISRYLTRNCTRRSKDQRWIVSYAFMNLMPRLFAFYRHLLNLRRD